MTVRQLVQVWLMARQTLLPVGLAAVPMVCATSQPGSALVPRDGQGLSVICRRVQMIATTKVCALLEHAFVTRPSLVMPVIWCAVLMTALVTAFA